MILLFSTVVIGEVTAERFEIVPNDYNGHVRIVYDVDVTKVYKGVSINDTSSK